MSSGGNCFVVMPPSCADNIVYFGRNAEDENLMGVAQEVLYYNAHQSVEDKMDMLGICLPMSIILQKPKPGIWGGDCGSNEANVCVAITWTDGNEGDLTAYDVVRLCLGSSDSADDAVGRAGQLITNYGTDNCKFSLIICDPTKAWLLSCAGKLWAAQSLESGHHHVPTDGLAVTTNFSKSCNDLGGALQALGNWNGEGEINFAACFNSVPVPTEWRSEEPVGDGTFTLISMFEILRNAANTNSSRSATVFQLCDDGISCYWFTATPNANDSVFKPFVFAPNPKISPLTQFPNDGDLTILHKLHAQRKSTSIDRLRALEETCVEELAAYLRHLSELNEELDELMKDCVEAEVKFYR